MNKYKSNVFLKENGKKDIKIEMTFKGRILYTFVYFFYACKLENIRQQLYNKIHLNNVLVFRLFLK